MATNQTTNYNLSQWQPNDPVLRADFNADNQKVDAALAAKGNCRIVAGTYVGDGTFGMRNPNHLTFDGKPLIVFIGDRESWSVWCMYGLEHATPSYSNNMLYHLDLSWEAQGLSWYCIDESANHQLNQLGKTYSYMALLAAE